MITPMKYTVIIIISIVFLSCSNYKLQFVPTDDIIKSKLDDAFFELYKIDTNELYFSFTKSYNNYHIKVIENDSILYDSLVTTGDKGLAKTFKVNGNSDVTVYFEEFKKPLKIKKENLRNYKLVFVYKQNGKVLVEFNNGKVGL